MELFSRLDQLDPYETITKVRNPQMANDRNKALKYFKIRMNHVSYLKKSTNSANDI